MNRVPERSTGETLTAFPPAAEPFLATGRLAGIREDEHRS